MPRLYRILVSVIALAVFVAAGTWAAYVLPYPTLISVGASIGLAVGALSAYFLLHEPRPHRSAQASRARRTPLH